MTYANIIETLFERFPFLEQKYLDEGNYIFGLAHLCFPIIFVPYIREIVKNNDIGAIVCVCEFLEDMESCKDELVNELLVVSVLETMLSERSLLETLKKYFKVKTKERLLFLEKAYGWDNEKASKS